MDYKDLSDNQIKDLLQKRVNDLKGKIAQLTALKDQLSKAEKALAVYRQNEPEVTAIDFSTITVINSGKNHKITAAGKMEHVLELYRVPLTSSELLKAINEEYPRKKIAAESWSPQLSSIYRDEDKPFKRAEFPENPQETRFFYGLKAWFDGDNLKEEFLSKLSKRHKMSYTNLLFK